MIDAPRKRFSLTALLGVVLMLIGGAVGFALRGNYWPHIVYKPVYIHVTQPARPSMVPPRPILPVGLVAGSPDDPHNRQYACINGYLPTDLTIGAGSSVAGDQFKATETADATGILVKVTINRGFKLGGVIIVTAAHVLSPTGSPEYALSLPLSGPGDTSFDLQDGTYGGPVDHATLCIKPL